MSGPLRAAWHIQRPLYRELAYETIYGVPLGNLLPNVPPEELGRRGVRRVAQSKLLVAGLIAFLSAGTALLLTPTVRRLLVPSLPAPLFETTVVGALLALELTLIWWTALQLVPTFLTSPIFPNLELLPIPEKVRTRAALLLFLRLFDVQVLAALLFTPLCVGAALASPLAGLALLPGLVAVAILAMALSLATGRFFVRHVRGSPGGGRRTLVRWTYLLLWAIPAFALYGFISFGPRLVFALSVLVGHGPSVGIDALFAVFPLPLSAAPALAANGGSLDLGPGPLPFLFVGLGALAYGLLTVAAASWLWSGPRALATAQSGGAPAETPAAIPFVRRSPARSVLTKDLRVASRIPGYAFLILLPLLDAVALGLFTVVSAPGPAATYRIALAAVATSGLVATFFGPAFFATELVGYAYTRVLPLTDRSLVLGKLYLVVGLYLTAGATVLAITLVRLFEPLPFAAFVLSELPAVAAAALLELGVLTWVARRRGLPIANLYSGSFTVVAVALPGLFASGAPLLYFLVAGGSDPLLAAGRMALLALAELGAAATFCYLAARPGSR